MTAPRKPLPPVDVLHQLLRYEPETGKLFWRERSQGFFKCLRSASVWNARYANKEAFTSLSGPDGYRSGTIENSPYRAHRIIWALYYWVEPECDIDHINGIKSDNRIYNLRLATHEQNMRNQKLSRINSSGYKGVTFHRRSKRWRAEIGYEMRQVYLGLFATKEEAYEAYQSASIRLHGEFGSPAALANIAQEG